MRTWRYGCNVRCSNRPSAFPRRKRCVEPFINVAVAEKLSALRTEDYSEDASTPSEPAVRRGIEGARDTAHFSQVL